VGTPERLDHGVGEADLYLGKHAAELSEAEQSVAFVAYVLDARVGDDHGSFAGRRWTLLSLGEELAGGLRFLAERELPGQSATAEVVDDRVQIGFGFVEESGDRDIDVPAFVGPMGANALFGFWGRVRRRGRN
jgi:hypothetical protein